jgi:hypothetical protein
MRFASADVDNRRDALLPDDRIYGAVADAAPLAV